MTVYPDDTLHQFEFNRIKELVEQNCRSLPAKAMARAMEIEQDHAALNILLHQVHEYFIILNNRLYFPDSSFEDISREISLLKVPGAVLTAERFDIIRSMSETMNGLIRFLTAHQTTYPHLNLLLEGTYETNEIIRLINEIIDQHQEVKSSASRELGNIRTSLNALKRESDRRFRSFVMEARKQGWLRDNEENFYNGRRVLSVLSEYKRTVKGIIHGSSDTGKTTFIEPAVTVELNNEIIDLTQQERREVHRLLRQLTNQIRPFHQLISAYFKSLTLIDFTRAKAYLAVEMKAGLPNIQDNPGLHLIQARHPLLYLQNQASGKATVPLTIELNKENRIMIISGPNAGGKSVALRTAGLLQLMLQSGMLVTAEPQSVMCFFSLMICDIGDSQSIEYALSTYSGRLQKMKYLLERTTPQTFFLIDEFGTGTDPELGGAIAEVILEEVSSRKAIGIVTTHYTNIKLLADKLDGVVNANMQFDPQTLQPQYVLQTGQPGSSYTFEVARKTGIPEQILKRASGKVQREKVNLNKLLSSLQQEKIKLGEAIQSYKLKEESALSVTRTFDELSDKLRDKLEKESEKMEEINRLSELGRKWISISNQWEVTNDANARKAIIQKFTKMMDADRKRKMEAAAAEKKARKQKRVLQQQSQVIKVGTKVKLLNSKQTGVVEEIVKNKARVTFGAIKSIVSLENLQVLE